MTELSAKAQKPRRMAREPKGKAAAVAEEKAPATDPSTKQQQAPRPTAPEKGATKTKMLLELLSSDEGTTLDQMVEATGWLPHTTRAALTGLKKKGHTISSEKADGGRVYRLATAGE